MTYNVFGGTLNLTQSIYAFPRAVERLKMKSGDHRRRVCRCLAYVTMAAVESPSLPHPVGSGRWHLWTLWIVLSQLLLRRR